MSVFSDAVRDHAPGLPGTVTGIACAGTPIERLTVVAGKKAFVFVGDADLRLRPEASLAACVVESYRTLAPKKLSKQLDVT